MFKKILLQLQEHISRHRHELIILLGVVCVVAIYITLRVSPVVYESVAYTYDQGRDFAAAKDIVVNRNLVLIGPTTGMQGVFHGVVWYYVLAIGYMLMQGSIYGYYVVMFIISALSSGALVWGLRKHTSDWIALLGAAMIATSSYFVYTSTFASNTILMLPAIVLYMYGVLESFRKASWKSALCIGLGMGFLLESEFAFGVFVLPASILTYLMVHKGKGILTNWKYGLIALGGSVIAVLPRIVFELKYNFMQTRTLLNFSDRRVEIDPTFIEILSDRAGHMTSYVHSLVQNETQILLWIMLVGALYGLVKGRQEIKPYLSRFTSYMIGVFFVMFGLTFFYTKNPFYGYYFEGLAPLIFAVVMVGLYALTKIQPRIALVLTTFVLVMLFIHGGWKSYQAATRGFVPEGLHMHTVAIKHVIDRVDGERFCLRMYTPPVITYTYSYLLDQEVGRYGKDYPYDSYIDSECWYFIEADSNKDRRADWMTKNIPAGAKRVYLYIVSDNLQISKWSYDGRSLPDGEL